MKIRLMSTLVLVAGLVAACSASATSTQTPAEDVIAGPTVVSLSLVPPVDPSSESTAAPTQTLVPTVVPVATSRGPELEATDPRTVTMASGGLQFIEFFEFW